MSGRPTTFENAPNMFENARNRAKMPENDSKRMKTSETSKMSKTSKFGSSHQPATGRRGRSCARGRGRAAAAAVAAAVAAPRPRLWPRPQPWPWPWPQKKRFFNLVYFLIDVWVYQRLCNKLLMTCSGLSQFIVTGKHSKSKDSTNIYVIICQVLFLS